MVDARTERYNVTTLMLHSNNDAAQRHGIERHPAKAD